MSLQKQVMDKMKEAMKAKDTVGSGLLELPCGFGKTALGLHICSLLKKKTLVIVHKEFLMNQWIERIEQFLPEALSEEKIEEVVLATINKLGASGMQDMGKVMGIVSKELAGKADGKTISILVKKNLA